MNTATINSYQDFPFTAEFYDHVTHHNTLGDQGFYVEMARESGGDVLELGSGTGRVLLDLARAGFNVMGLELAETMLDVCRAKLAEETPAVRDRVILTQGNMRCFDLDRLFSLVIVPFRSFQILPTVEDQIACLGCARRHLTDGGRLILNLFNPSLHALTDEDRKSERGDEEEFTMPDGRRVVRKYRNPEADLHGQTTACELIYYVTHPDGKKERLVHSFTLRYLFRYEVEHLLARCGFELESVYSDFDKSAFGSTYPGELIVVARRSAWKKAPNGFTSGPRGA